jgi:hypothetical protein
MIFGALVTPDSASIVVNASPLDRMPSPNIFAPALKWAAPRTVLLVNTGTMPAQFTLDLFGDTGRPLPLPLDTGGTRVPPGELARKHCGEQEQWMTGLEALR